MNAIPLQFTLNENQSEDHENYPAYFGVLQSLADNNWQVGQLDSTSVLVLINLKETGNPRITALARGLLVKGGFYKYIETINFPDKTKSSKILPYEYRVSTSKTRDEMLWLFPSIIFCQ